MSSTFLDRLLWSCSQAMIDEKYLQSLTYPLAMIRSPVWLFDVDGQRIIWANAPALVLWDADTLTELQCRDMSAGMSRKVFERLEQYCADLTGTTKSVSEYWTFYPNGRPSTCEYSISAIKPPSGRRWLMVHTTRQNAVYNSDTLYRNNALLHTSVCVSVYSVDGQLVYSNPAARRMLGSERLTLGQRFLDQDKWRTVRSRLEMGDEVDTETEVMTAKGQTWHGLTLEICPDPVHGTSSILVSETDVSSRHHAQQLVHELAYFDALTALPNRTSWFSTLESRLDAARENKQCLSVLFIDLNRFKLINDTMGHTVGDKLLIAVAERLRECVSGDEYLARLAGDEFTLLLTDSRRSELSRQKAHRVVDALASPIVIDGHEILVTPSIGISQFPDNSTDADQLMQHADLAMYVAKQAGGGFQYFEEHMHIQIYQRRIIEQDLDDAIETSALEIFYQPKVNASSGKTRGVEALLRWKHPSLGWIAPEIFIKIAEETGKIGAITQYVLQRALSQQTRWSKQGFDVSVAVNVSPLEFQRPEFVSLVKRSLSMSGCNPEKLELEITESVLMIDSDDIQSALSELSDMRVKLSLDDFGSGYSNLGYLQKFPLNSIKIDRSFLDGGAISPVIELIIGVGKKLSLSVVVEGVETARQRDVVMRHGCDQMQGFLFAMPMESASMTDYLSKDSCRSRRWSSKKKVAS